MKIFSYSLLLLFLALYVIASNNTFMRYVSLHKSGPYQKEDEKNIHGDLFGMCFLSKYKVPRIEYHIKPVQSTEKCTNLYVIGDSYLSHLIYPNYFSGIDSLFFTTWFGDENGIQLNRHKKNILIVETTERAFLRRFKDAGDLQFKFINKKKVEAERKPNSDLMSCLFNKDINENLEYLLFDNPIFTYVKQLRADLDFYMFHRLPETVKISDDESCLFYNETIDTSKITSAFRPINDVDFKNSVANCHTYIKHYKEMGIDQVYISVIPNPVTILSYHHYRYNGLIPKLRQAFDTTINFIDVYDEFKQSKKQLYFISDSHWNSNGIQIWVDKVNQELSTKPIARK